MALALVQQQAAPNPGELAAVFRTHAGMVFRTAYRLTGSAADAEDVLQTIFMRLLRRDSGAEPVANLESYLRRAAVHASLDLIRERARLAPEPPPEDQPSAEGPGALELRDLLRQAIARLSPPEAEVFTLRFIDGHSNGEIARMLGKSKVRIAVMVHNTRRKLRAEIENYSKGGKS